MSMLSTLNQRQQLFIYHYFKGSSLTRSAIEAGYTKKPECAAVQGSRLLKNVNVVNALEYLNEQAGITVPGVISKLASVFNGEKTKPSDVIKLSKLFFKFHCLDLDKSDTRKPTRNRRRAGVGSISYSFDSLFKPNGDTPNYNKEVIEEDNSSKEIEPLSQPRLDSLQIVSQAHNLQEDNPLKVERAIQKPFPKAVPKTTEMKNPTPTYSLFSFKDEDNLDRAQNNPKVFYPA